MSANKLANNLLHKKCQFSSKLAAAKTVKLEENLLQRFLFVADYFHFGPVVRAINNDDECRKQNFSIPPMTILSLLLLAKNLLYFFSHFSAGREFGSISRVIGGIVLKSSTFVIVF